MAQKKFEIQVVSDKRIAVLCQERRIAIDKISFKDGGTSYQLVWWVSKKRQRRAYPSQERAIEEAKIIIAQLIDSRADLAEIDSTQLAYLRECQRKMGSVPLHEAVEYYHKYFQPRIASKTCADVVAEFCAGKDRDPDLSPDYKSGLHSIYRHLTNAYGSRRISSITSAEVERLVQNEAWGSAMRFSVYASLRTIFNYAKHRKYLPPNEDTVVIGVAAPRVRAKTPQVFTVEEMQTVLNRSTTANLPFVAICAFAGGRRAEIMRAKFEDIDFDERIIKLDTEITKTGQRRTLTIPDNLFAWLEPYRGMTGKIVQTSDPLDGLSDHVAWKRNGLRKSFISYHLARHQNAPLTAELAGNSVPVILSHYKSLVTKSAAEQYFQIYPQSQLTIPPEPLAEPASESGPVPAYSRWGLRH